MKTSIPNWRTLTLPLVASLGVSVAWGAPKHTAPQSSDESPQQPISKQELASRYPGLTANNIHDGPMPGLYEVVIANNVSYITTDGRFLIRGDIVDLSNQKNLTAATRAANRSRLLAAIDPSTEIVFSPKDGAVKYRVTVFTDVDCAYCRELHRHIAEYNALGIEVRYVSYPRTGPNTESWTRAEGVWCAADRNTALTEAKLGKAVAAVPGCTSTPVAAEYQLGQLIGLSGTPGVYSDTGEELGGYVPPADLLAALQKSSSAK
jgi:thiol:disulfide interchange protein DsbC